MAEATENKPAPTKAPSVAEKVSVIRASLKQFEGKPGYNQALWQQQFLNPLVTEYNKSKSPEVAAKILALPDHPDCSSKQFDVNFGGVPVPSVVV